jgi:hypothetical protein
MHSVSAMMDIVVVVKPSDQNEELRYAIRSWEKHVSYRNIVIAGYKPSWLTNVKHVQTKQRGTKWQNSTNNLIQACHQGWISEDFILMNDDFFIMQPMPTIPTYHRGSIEEYARKCAAIAPRGRYLIGMRQTKQLLMQWGFSNPVSYELHAPMLINRSKFLEVIRKQRRVATHIEVIHKRTLYGNYYRIGGTLRQDVKISDVDKHDFDRYDILSTLDSSFYRGEIGKYLRQRFPEKSQYE